MVLCGYLHFVGLASGNPKARVPYLSIKSIEICGFPDELEFGPPSSFNNEELQRIIDAAPNISFRMLSVLCIYYWYYEKRH